MITILLLFACGPSPSEPVRLDPSTLTPCPDFAAWKEIPSPLEGERCLQWYHYASAGDSSRESTSIVCRPIDEFKLVPCADPKADLPLRTEQ